jgi:hypothetical protein
LSSSFTVLKKLKKGFAYIFLLLFLFDILPIFPNYYFLMKVECAGGMSITFWIMYLEVLLHFEVQMLPKIFWKLPLIPLLSRTLVRI